MGERPRHNPEAEHEDMIKTLAEKTVGTGVEVAGMFGKIVKNVIDAGRSLPENPEEEEKKKAA